MALTASAAIERFAQRAATVIKQPPLDPRVIPIGILAAGLFATEALYIALSDLNFPPVLLVKIFDRLILLLVGGLVARRYAFVRTGDTLQAFSLLAIFSTLIVVATVVLSRYSQPFADEFLSRADHALGLDWMAWFGVFHRHPSLVPWARWAYTSFYWQGFVLTLVLFASGRAARGWRFVNAWAIALIFTAVIYPFVPAVGPYLTYGIPHAAIPTLPSEHPWTMGPLIEAIRTHRNTDVIGSLGGLVCFPSFHACGAIIFIWTSWDMRALRWPILLLNLALLAAVPIIGYHYFTDMIGGIAVALVALVLSEHLTTRLEKTGR